MSFKRIIWLVVMACLSLSLYTIVMSRSAVLDTDIIIGGEGTGVFAGVELVSNIDPNAQAVAVDDGLNWPDIDITQTQYSMVRGDMLLSSAYEPDLALKEDGESIEPIYGTRYQAFERSAKPYLDKMLQDMEALGFTPYIASSYRTYSYQNQLFNTKATGIYMEMGYKAQDWASEEYQEAVEKAKKYTAVAGASEHQLGLAVDIWDCQRQKLSAYTNMDEDFRNWLEEHACEYGFIQRYPSKKCLITGWDEPWHYRYVGEEVATFIRDNDICYEEFYKHYSPNFEY